MRIGIDLGGTKIEGIALGSRGEELLRHRIASPRDSYERTLGAIVALVRDMETKLGATGTVGVGIPGAISPATGLVKNSNSVWMNGRPLAEDLPVLLGRPVRFANDANCFALSEATDGAGAGAPVVFGVILGTGTGGGIVVNGTVLQGPNAVAGEWGHNPLPAPRDAEWPDFPWGPAVSAIVGAEGAAAFLDLIESGRVKQLRCPKCRHGGYAGTLIPAVDYLQAMRLRAPMKKALGRLFGQYDAIAAPTRASVAYPADKNFEDVYPGIGGGPALIPGGNLCGLPALAIPNGFGENGLPTSLSFMGPAFSERELVALGNACQGKSDWHLRRPPGA